MKCKECLNDFLIENAIFCPYCGSALFSCALPIVSNETTQIHSWQAYQENTVYRDCSLSNGSTPLCLCDSRSNDLRVTKRYQVAPDTVYFITADIKTENVINHENAINPLGASISSGDYNCSRSILGTSEWQRIGVLGRSDEYGNLTVSFNLGYYFNTCSGKVWFDGVHITPAENYVSGENVWRFLAVIITNTGIDTIDNDTNQRILLSHTMSQEEICAIKKSFIELEADFNKDAGNLFKIKVDTLVLDTPCTDYTKMWAGYSISDTSALLYLKSNGIDVTCYDHIILTTALPSLPATYFGLGGGNIYGRIGYSFVLHTNIENSLAHFNGEWENMWPPAIYVHEFLHSVEFLSNALGLNVPRIDEEHQGYTFDFEGREWYRDFIHKRININGSYHGVDPRMWRLRPSLFTL